MFTQSPQTPILEVRPSASIIDAVTSFRITLFDTDSRPVADRTLARGQLLGFQVSPGEYLIRTEGLDGNGVVVGYFDRVVTVSGRSMVTDIPGLRYNAAPPAATFIPRGAGTPFLLFVEIPETLQQSVPFAVSVQGFNGQGNPPDIAFTGISLTSQPGLEASPAAEDGDTVNRATFTALSFPSTTEGTVTFMVSADGVEVENSRPVPLAPAFFRTLERDSLSSDGGQANGASSSSSLSVDGRFLAFGSGAANLVADDTNGADDIFVQDRQTGQTVRVSISSSGVEGDGGSYSPTISGDGRYVAFQSVSTNLVLNDTNGVTDIFVHDRQSGITSRVSLASDGTQGDSFSIEASMSLDGSYVTFSSLSTNLVSNDTNGAADIFVHDLGSAVTSRVSVASDGSQGSGISFNPSLSGDGRYVAFYSSSDNLVFGDTNSSDDVFVHDRQAGTTVRVSVASDGGQANGPSFSFQSSISADGSIVAFASVADNLVSGDSNATVDVFVHDLPTGVTSRVSVGSDGTEGNDFSISPSISADGRYVVYYSDADNLVANDTNGVSDIFVHDRQTRVNARVSLSNTGGESNDSSGNPAISGDGRTVAYESAASNLVTGDTNGDYDVFSVRSPVVP